MNLNEKIKEIRQKPELVRLRYVWSAVAVFMFLVIILWVFSLKETLSRAANETQSIDFKEEYRETKEKSMLDDLVKDADESMLNSIEKETLPQ